MASVYYVNCGSCGKEYYLESNLYHLVKTNPERQRLKCPFCKTEFTLDPGKDKARGK